METTGLGIVLVADHTGQGSMLESYAIRLVDEGYRVVRVGDWVGEGVPDALGIRAIRGGRDRLKQDGFSAICMGFGIGGLFARLAACTLPGISGAVDFGGQLVYPQVTPDKPAQPLDLIPGLTCPLLCHHALLDPGIATGDIEALAGRVARTGQVFQQFSYRVGPGFYHPELPEYDLDAAESAWWRSMRFLGHLVG